MNIQKEVYIDCITNNSIPEDRVITVGDSAFDIYTLIKYHRESGSYMNPFTRTLLSDEIAEKIKIFREKDRISLILDRDISLMTLLAEVHKKHPYYGDALMRIGYYPIRYKGKDLYDINLFISLYDVFTDRGKIEIVFISDLNPWIRRGAGIRKNKIYKYALANHMEWLMDIILKR